MLFHTDDSTIKDWMLANTLRGDSTTACLPLSSYFTRRSHTVLPNGAPRQHGVWVLKTGSQDRSGFSALCEACVSGIVTEHPQRLQLSQTS